MSRLCELEEKLAEAPQGKLLVKRHGTEPAAGVCMEQVGFDAGRGLAELWTVFPGVVLLHGCYSARQCGFRPGPLRPALEVNHCRQGRAGWETPGGRKACLGPGDLLLHAAGACEPVVSFPLGFYEGISISADLEILEREPPEILREAGIEGRQLAEKLCGQSGYAAMPASAQIEHIFSELYDLPPRLRMPYFKLKFQELLLFLSMPEAAETPQPDRYHTRQVETVRAIHAQLTERLDRRYTIEELARQHLINTSALKAAFKAVYGQPVAAYMREYRVREAARLLREEGGSIAEVAAAVGYESQSKFSAAFKEVFQVLPTAYRKQFQRRQEQE